MAGKCVYRGCMNSARDTLILPLSSPTCAVLFSLMLSQIWNSFVGGKNPTSNSVEICSYFGVNLFIPFSDSYTTTKQFKWLQTFLNQALKMFAV